MILSHPLPSLLLVSLLFPTGGHAQNSNPSKKQVTEAIVSGEPETALSLLSTLIEKKPKDISLLKAKMNILLGLRRNWEAMVTAKALVNLLPPGLEKESLRSFSKLVHKTKGELQLLIEKAVILRESRDPQGLLKIWKKLDKLRPEDPLVHFGMGIIYASYGKEYNVRKALQAFRKFLALTSDDQFHVGSIYTPSELASSLERFSTIGKESGLPEVRMEVHGFLKQLKEKKPLYLMTPMATIQKMERKYEGEKKKFKGEIAKAEESIARCQRYLDTYRPSRKHDLHTNKRRKIRQLERFISLKKKKIATLTLVLKRMRESYQ